MDLLLVVYALVLAAIIYSWIKLFQNKSLKDHRKAFWFFIFMAVPLFGYLTYLNTEGRRKFKKPLQSGTAQ